MLGIASPFFGSTLKDHQTRPELQGNVARMEILRRGPDNGRPFLSENKSKANLLATLALKKKDEHGGNVSLCRRRMRVLVGENDR